MFLRFLVARGGIEPPTLRMNDPLPTDRYWLVIDHPSELIPAGRVRPIIDGGRAKEKTHRSGFFTQLKDIEYLFHRRVFKAVGRITIDPMRKSAITTPC